MLDLEAILTDLRGLAAEVAGSAQHGVRMRRLAREQLDRAAAMPGLRQAALASGQDMAHPAEGVALDEVHPAPPPPDYAVLATDGSQVAPDYHHVAPWSVINAGSVVFRYGVSPGRERALLRSTPRLLPPRRGGRVDPALDPDAEPDADARGATAIVSAPLEAERLLTELEAARALIEEEAEPGASVLLLDGPLVQWRMVHEIPSRADRERVIASFRGLLAACEERAAPVAGYISRSRAVQWITLLRFAACPEVGSSGRLCPDCAASLFTRERGAHPPEGSHHAALAGLRDVELAAELLPEPGMRTAVLELASTVWRRVAGRGSAGFFYINTGRPHEGGEIARVEIPSWVWKEPRHLDMLHSALADQCEVGRGYPMALAEAHEQAVVRGAERASFYAAIERILSDCGVHGAATSAKAASKRRPMA